MSQAASDTGGDNSPLLSEGELVGGRYRVDRCLGGGGMASVYRATHEGLDQPVALKVVSPAIRELPGIVQRFMREARAATRLKGEHVVRVYDVGTTERGAPFLAMELLEGKDLAEMIDCGMKPSVDDAIDYVLQTCEALAEVHGLGIVHRDLKPANLFITSGNDGMPCVKLIDFGISRVDSPLSPKDAIGLTNPEVVMGSPRYMPPEQMESAAAVDSRSDIWGVGAILYEILMGDPPFDGESLMDIYAAAVKAEPKLPGTVRDDVPEELDAVIMKCLAVDPNERFQDVAELAMALAPLGDARAAGRASAITRVLETTRARGQGTPVDVADATNKNTPSSSHIRRRVTPSQVRRRRRNLGLGALAVMLFGIGLGAKPIVDRFDSSAAKANATPTLSSAEALPEPPSTTAEPFGPPPPPVTADTKPSTAGPAPPPWRPTAKRDDDQLFEDRK